jgi:hypothetical protein
MLNIHTADTDHLQFVQGPVAYHSQEDLRKDEQEGGDIVEYTAALVASDTDSHFLLKMFITTAGEFAHKLGIRVLDGLDAMFPVVGEYEEQVLSFMHHFSQYGENNDKLYEIFKTQRYQDYFLKNFKETNKEPLKEHYDYDLIDDLEVVFY